MWSRSSSAQDQSYISTPRGDAHVVPLNVFLHSILPPLPDNLDLSEVLRKLIKIETKPYSPGRWRGFPDDPQNSRRPTEKVFLPLENLVNSILQVDGSGETPFAFFQNPVCTTYAEHRTSNELSDAFFSHGPATHWTDVVAFGEYNKGDTEMEAREVRNILYECRICILNLAPLAEYLQSDE